MGSYDNGRRGGKPGITEFDEPLHLRDPFVRPVVRPKLISFPEGTALPEQGEELVVQLQNCRHTILQLLLLTDMPFKEADFTSSSTLYVRLNGQDIQAFAVTSSSEEAITIDWIYVCKDYRESGFARELWDRIRLDNAGATLKGFIADKTGRIEKMVTKDGAKHDGAVSDDGRSWILTPSE